MSLLLILLLAVVWWWRQLQFNAVAAVFHFICGGDNRAVGIIHAVSTSYSWIRQFICLSLLTFVGPHKQSGGSPLFCSSSDAWIDTFHLWKMKKKKSTILDCHYLAVSMLKLSPVTIVISNSSTTHQHFNANGNVSDWYLWLKIPKPKGNLMVVM